MNESTCTFCGDAHEQGTEHWGYPCVAWMSCFSRDVYEAYRELQKTFFHERQVANQDREDMLNWQARAKTAEEKLALRAEPETKK